MEMTYKNKKGLCGPLYNVSDVGGVIRFKKNNSLMHVEKKCSQKDLEMDCSGIISFSKKNITKKNAAKKCQKKGLILKKETSTLGVFYINLNYIKRAIFRLNRVPKNRAKGTKKSGIEANFSSDWSKVLNYSKISQLFFEAEYVNFVKVNNLIGVQKGTKKSGMRLSEAKNCQKGTKKSGMGTKIQGMRLSEAGKYRKGTKFRGMTKGVVIRDKRCSNPRHVERALYV
jgi:hypothetical protein